MMKNLIRKILKEEIESRDKKYYVDKSKIEGTGVFSNRDLKEGEVIGLLHTINKIYDDYDFTELGKLHNHSDEPNCYNKLVGNKRFLVTLKNIGKGEELTSNYRLQPDLEQPEHWDSYK